MESWKRTSNLLPEKSGLVLAYQENFNDEFQMMILWFDLDSLTFHGLYDSDYEIEQNNCVVDFNTFFSTITHWMPLPEKPNS